MKNNNKMKEEVLKEVCRKWNIPKENKEYQYTIIESIDLTIKKQREEFLEFLKHLEDTDFEDVSDEVEQKIKELK